MANSTNRGVARRGSQRGSVAVEFALVLPILLALLLGTITAGLGYSHLLGAADAVREGARFGATTLSTTGWASAVQTRTVAQSGGALTTNQVCVKLLKAPSTPVSASACNVTLAGPEPTTPAVITPGTCVVKVWSRTPFQIKTGLFPPITNQVDKQSVTVYERTCP